jgi:hypothetical protein
MEKSRNLQNLLFFTCLFFGFAIVVWGKSAGPDMKLTGAFGESTCLQCHTAHKLNEGRSLGGSLEIRGIPERYEAGKVYTLTIEISHPNQSRWGFELSARTADSGLQANQLRVVDSNTQMKADSGILYGMHTRTGTRKGMVDRASFSFEWTAQESSDLF